MSFKQSPFPMVKGTTGHGSALKKTKQGNPTYKEAYEAKGEKGEATRKKYKTQEEFTTAAEDWWKGKEGQKKATTEPKFKHRIIKAEKKEVKKDDTKKVKEVKQKVDVKTAKGKRKIVKVEERQKVKEARRKYGRGSAEVKAAKLAKRKAKKEATLEVVKTRGKDIADDKGILSGIRKRRNIRRQKRLEKKIGKTEA